MRLAIEPISLHWLYDAEPTDLCAHGGLRVALDRETIFETTSDGEWTLSTGALHLLRTVEQDYDAVQSPSRQLIPCCGNYMVFDEALGEVVNMPCPSGIEWGIRHVAAVVIVRFPNGRTCNMPEDEWRRAVHDFSARVRAFYFAEPARVVDNLQDAEWHPRFVAEWDRLHEAASSPSG